MNPHILMIAPIGRAQDSLRVLLSGLPITLIGPVGEARSALALIQEWHPALVVLDFSLPKTEVTPHQ